MLLKLPLYRSGTIECFYSSYVGTSFNRLELEGKFFKRKTQRKQKGGDITLKAN